MPKILIVDDEPYIRRFLSTLLFHKGYQVTLAEDGQNGLDRFFFERPHVMVLDLHMPRVDGLTVLRLVRGFNPLQPVVILSCGPTSETVQEVRGLGVTEFVEKGSAVHLLDGALQRVLVPKLSNHSAIPEGPCPFT